MRSSKIAALLALLLVSACSNSSKKKNESPANPPESAPLVDGVDAANLSYHKDIRPIIDSKCASCHSVGGIGGLVFEGYPQVVKFKGSIKDAVVSRRMPPWIADAGHQVYKDDLSLTPSELSRLVSWIDLGLKEGNPSDYVKPSVKEAFVPDQTLNVLTDNGRYLPKQNVSDDYRCFIVPFDGKLDQSEFITGFNAHAGNKKIVHHIVAYLVDASIVSYLQELDQEEEGRGYQCFGGATPDRLGDPKVQQAWEAKYPGSISKLNDLNYWLAHWAPGMDEGYAFPTDTGISIPKGGAFVLQMHYYSQGAKGEEDTGSTFSIQTAKKVRKPAFYFPLTEQKWLASKSNRSLVIPANSEASFSTEKSLENIAAYGKRVLKLQSGVKSLESHSANLHMHAFGKSGVISQGRIADGKSEVLLNVSKWDLHWQRDFQLNEPKVIPFAELSQWSRKITCTYANPDNNEIFGGFGSYDEMCFDFGYFAFELE